MGVEKLRSTPWILTSETTKSNPLRRRKSRRSAHCAAGLHLLRATESHHDMAMRR